MGKKEKAQERRDKRRQEISILRTIPYSDQQRWWSNDTIAVVTGSNRGIGFEIAHQLASHGLTVVLTSRETRVGEEAMKIMQEGGLNVVFHQLDIVDPASIETFSFWIKEKYGGLDILINNAGVNFNFGTDNSVEFAETVTQTNYFGTKSMIKAMIPLMRPSPFGARIVNVTSRLGRLNGRRNRIANVSLRQQLEDVDSLSEELIDSTVNTFLEQVKNGTWESGGWPQVFTDYSLSKLAANAYTRLMVRILSDQPEGHKIYMNCYCPGWVQTAMTAWAGHTSPEVAADTAVWLALISDQFVSDPIPSPWPQQFHATTIMNYTGGLRKVDLWYDWPNKRYLHINQYQLGKKLYDVEWQNGTSFYFTLDSTQECTIRHFPVGILRPNWLEGANYLGQRIMDGFLCNAWEKVDFIWYYEDVVTKLPVYWHFYDGLIEHIMTFEVGKVLEDSKWQAPAYCFKEMEKGKAQDHLLPSSWEVHERLFRGDK